MKTSYKHLFFDVDGTITRSRQPMSKNMRSILESLSADLIYVSGGTPAIIEHQVGDLANTCILLGENGNRAKKYGDMLWEKLLAKEATEEILEHIRHFERLRDWDVRDKNDLIDMRGCQISYSPFGHNEELARKEAFDPEKSKRKEMLEKNTAPLRRAEIRIGGTTCFDYIEKGRHKGYNVQKLIDHFCWKNEDCLYLGDQLDPGGNDYAVVGVTDTHAVTCPEDTEIFLRQHFIS